MKVMVIGLAAALLALPFSAKAEESVGEKLFTLKCGTCHSMEPGKHKVGPSLAGVVGRKAGATDFERYRALKGADFVWTVENLNDWIANPKGFIGKPTAMTVKVRIQEERDAIIDHLKGED